MNKYVLFLKGVNIGGHNNVKMDTLRKMLNAQGFEYVRTYINSGNIILQSKEDKEKIKEQITGIIGSGFGIKVEMIVKSEQELQDLVKNNPFDIKKEADHAKRAVVMLSKKVDPDQTRVFKEEGKVDENFYLVDDQLFIYYHNGFGKSKFTTGYIERKLHVTATGRNWNTILKLTEMIRD